MEYVLIIIAGLLIAPYLMYGWLFGLTLIKRLYDKEWKETKGLIGAYEKLTPEQRMDLEIHRDQPTTPTQQQPKSDKTTQWLGSPTPQAELKSQNEQAFREGLVHKTPVTGWESNEEANRAPDTTITNPLALAPKP